MQRLSQGSYREQKYDKIETGLFDKLFPLYKEMMFKDAFIKLDSTQTARMCDLLNPKLDIMFDPGHTTAVIHNLDFYEGHFLVELSRQSEHPPLVRQAVCNESGDITLLDWTNVPIYKLNKSVPVSLNDHTVKDYVRFFFTYVRGAHGRFLIVDSVDDIDWREEPSAAGRKALGKMIDPVHIRQKETDGTYVLALNIVFKDSLFSAEVVVSPDGAVTMQNEELLVEDIPVADDLFGQ